MNGALDDGTGFGDLALCQSQWPPVLALRAIYAWRASFRARVPPYSGIGRAGVYPAPLLAYYCCHSELMKIIESEVEAIFDRLQPGIDYFVQLGTIIFFTSEWLFSWLGIRTRFALRL